MIDVVFEGDGDEGVVSLVVPVLPVGHGDEGVVSLAVACRCKCSLREMATKV